MPANTGGSAATRSTRAARRNRGGRPVPLIAVIGGCGGAGASTLAVSLAVTALGVGRRAILFDADPLGGGLEPLVALGTIAAAPCGPTRTARAWPHGIILSPHRDRPPGRDREDPDCEDPDSEVPDLALVTWGGGEGEPIPVAAMRDALRLLRTTTALVVVD